MRPDFQKLVALLPSGVQRVSPIGLALTPGTPAEVRAQFLARLTHLSRASTGERHILTAWLGDLLANGDKPRRGQITAYAQAAGLDAGTLSNAKLVCTRIPISCRHEALSWAHHCEVALVCSKPAEIERWLRLAEERRLSARELRLAIRDEAAAARPAGEEPGAERFALLRDLRAAARRCQSSQRIWQRWSPDACRSAEKELEPLAAFLDHVRRKAERTEAVALGRKPADLSVN